MIHTFELIQYLGQDELSDITTCLHFNRREQQKLFGNNRFQTVHRSLNSHHPENGIKDFYILRRDDDQTGYPCYYAIIEIEPLVMIRYKLTVDLFRATPYTLILLQGRFRHVMSSYLTHENLVNLSQWQCRRIDYTFNFHFNSTADKDLFLQLTKKTSRHVRTRNKRISSLRINEQSTAEGNHSVKVLFYDKQKQIRETYDNIPDSQKEELMQSAENIIRFEVQCLKGRVTTLKRKYQFADKSIIHYLNEDIAREVLISSYLNSVGKSNFYSFYWAKKTILASEFTNSKKQRLVQLLQLIAQARHVSIAKEQFIKGTKIKRTEIEVKGSEATFNHYLSDLAELDINSMLIPKERKVTHFTNPINQLLT